MENREPTVILLPSVHDTCKNIEKGIFVLTVIPLYTLKVPSVIALLFDIFKIDNIEFSLINWKFKVISTTIERSACNDSKI